MTGQSDQIIVVPLSAVHSYKQPREMFDADRLDELGESLRQRGQLQPVLMTLASAPGSDPKYVLIDGERRVRALRLIGAREVRGIVRGDVSSDERFVESVVSNSAREDLTPMEQSRAVARIAAMPGYDLKTREGVAKLAAVFGRAPGWVTHMLKLDTLAPEVKTLVEERKLPATAAAKLAEVKSPARQAELGNRIARLPMRSSAVDNAARQAVRVEQVREGGVPKTHGTQHGTARADARLVAELVGKVADTTEGLLDLPVARLREAYARRPKELQAAIASVAGAIEVLEQLAGALEKLAQKGVA